MNRDPLLVRILLRCYPARWRVRYGVEYAAMLCDTLTPAPWWRRPALVVNILRGAFDARLISPGGGPMTYRSPMSVAIWSAGLFTIAGLGFQKLAEDPALSATTHPGIGWSFIALVIAATIALAALAVAALPTALALMRGRANRALPLLAVPPIAFVCWYGLLRLALLLARNHRIHSATNMTAAALIIIGGLGVVAVTAWAASVVLRRVPTDAPPVWRRATLSVCAAGMAASTLACLIYGLSVRAADPAGFTRHDGILASPFLPSWILDLLLMAAATAITTAASRRSAAAGAA